MKRICIYCGSNSGRLGVYSDAAESLGVEIADRNITLVYGGASVGLMGIIADTVLRRGGRVIGVIPKSLVDKEVAHPGLSDLRVTSSMHERKQQMAEMSDGFVALPGGIGTLEELFEMWTWSQLGFHKKPIGLLNIQSYFESMLAFLRHSVDQGFVKQDHLEMLIVSSSPSSLIDSMIDYVPTSVSKWQDR